MKPKKKKKPARKYQPKIKIPLSFDQMIEGLVQVKPSELKEAKKDENKK